MCGRFTTPTLRKLIKERQRIRDIKDNKPSHFFKDNFRKVIFNVKSFVSKSKKQEEILYIPINIPDAISGGFADFVCGKGLEIEISDDALCKEWEKIAKESQFHQKLYNLVVDQSLYGYGVLRRRLVDQKKKIFVFEHIPFEYYYPELADLYVGEDIKQLHIVSPLYNTGLLQTFAQRKVKVQSYTKQDDGKYLLEEGEYTTGIDVASLTLNKELGTEVSEFPSVYIFDNNKGAGEFIGKSDFFIVMDLIEEINDRITQISLQFIKHFNAKMSVPAGIKSFLDKEDKSMDAMEVYVHGAGEKPAEYIENKNLLMQDALVYIDKVLRLIAVLTKTPPAFLGIDEKGGAEKVEALKMRMASFFQKVARKREVVSQVVENIVIDTLKHAGHNTDSLTVSIKFNDIDLKDDQQFFDKLMALKDKALLSNETTLGYSMDWDDEMVELELEKIAEEKQEADAMTPPPVDPMNPNPQAPATNPNTPIAD